MGGCPATGAVLMMLILGLPHLQAAKETVPDVLGALRIHGAPNGDGNLSNDTWRVRREHICQDDEYRHPSGAFCCKMCLAGFRKVLDCKGEGQVTNCSRCEKGSYTEVPNYVSKCMLCDPCRRGFRQIEISPCTTSRKTVCGCPGGEFQAQVGSDFQCKQCKECTNGKTLKSCEGFHDTICQCNSGFFHDIELTCRPCNECRSDECRDQCPLAIPIEQPVPKGTSPFLIALTGVFGGCLVLVGIWFVWKFYYRSSTSYNPVAPLSSPVDGTSQMETGLTKSTYLPGQPVQCSDPEVLLHVTAPCTSPMVSQLPDCVSDAGRTRLPEDPRVLYAVVDTVPARRWKEFVRRLGLSDNDIEMIEMQNRDCREGHYEMLQKWRCQTGVAGSTVEVISRVLREMDLSGCSEAIQDSLHPQA